MSPVSFIMRLTVAIILINLAVIALTGLSLYQSRYYYQERTVTTAQNLSDVLENELTGTIEKIGVTLFTVKYEYEKQSAAGHVDRQTMNTYIARVHSRLPYIDGLRIADERGRVVYGEDVPPDSQASLADRDHFTRQRDNLNAGLVISRVVRSRINGKRVIVFTQRLNHPDGSFAGIVLASVTLDNLTETFSELDVGKHGSISLRDKDLSVIARYPVPKEGRASIGDTEVSRKVREMLLKGQYAGTYVVPLPTGRIEQTLSYRKVSNYPLYIITDLASDDYLAQWRHEVAIMSALAAFFLLATLLSAGLIYRDWYRHRVAGEALAQQEMKFRTLLEFAPDALVISDTKGFITTVNRQAETMFGYERQELIGQPVEMLLAERFRGDHLAKRRDYGFVSPARELDGNSDWRAANKEGCEFSVSVRMGSIETEQGMMVAVAIRDVTERKQAEAELHNLNRDFVTLLESTSDFICYKDTNSRFRFCSQALAAITGHASWRDMIGKHDLEVFPKDMAQIYYLEELPIFRDGIPLLDKTDPYYDAKCRPGWISTNKWPVFDSEGKKVIGIFGISRDITERKRAEAQLQELNETLESRVNEAVGKARALALRLLQVQDEERKHLARELHDETGQLLTATSLCAHAILIQSENKEAAIHENAEFIIECISKTQGAVHDVIHSLRPSLLSELGLADSLRDLAKNWKRQNPKVTLELSLEDDSDNLNDLLNISIYRFVQEGLTNVAKHAEASHVSVQLNRETGSDELILTIADNGKGLDLACHTEGFGLRGMQERATAVGGELTISSRPGEGVHIVARLPVHPNFEVLPPPLA